MRTCVGCRRRAPASELLRVVAVEHGAEPPSLSFREGLSFRKEQGSREGKGEAVFSVVPDQARRRPGRGAHIHHDPGCLALAVRRRAFGRALRLTGVVDTGSLAEYFGVVGPDGRPGASEPSKVEEISTRTRKVGRPT